MPESLPVNVFAKSKQIKRGYQAVITHLINQTAAEYRDFHRAG